MSSHSKGVRTELLFRKKMEVEGWICEQKNWSRFKQKDFWNCFDFLCLKFGKVLLAQIKTGNSRKKEVIENFNAIKEHIPKNWQCEIHVYKGRGAWKVFDLWKLSTLQ